MRDAAAFSINGRFLTQAQTGVQRYALNVVEAMDAHLQGRPMRVALLAPFGARNPGLRHVVLKSRGQLSGQAWEQIDLPYAARGPLLNLCNTGPAFHRHQIVCIHDANVHMAPQSYSFAFRAYYRALQPHLARRARRITTVSADAAGQIARALPVKLGDIAVVPNGHEHALRWQASSAKKAPAFFSEDGPLRDKNFVLAIGSRASHKNLDLLGKLSGALEERGLKTVIAGGASGVFSTAPAAPESVITTGFLSDDDLAFLMDRALCLVFPSFTEGFGLPIIEAMARGCPVISSDRASMPEVCGDAALMAAPDDPAQWLAHIERLSASDALRSDLIGRGHARVPLFSWRKAAADYIDLLSDCGEAMR
jgi:glycosyltransferase involved in cell wall biosynthesis